MYSGIPQNVFHVFRSLLARKMCNNLSINPISSNFLKLRDIHSYSKEGFIFLTGADLNSKNLLHIDSFKAEFQNKVKLQMWRGLRLGFSNALPIKPDKEFQLK